MAEFSPMSEGIHATAKKARLAGYPRAESHSERMVGSVREAGSRVGNKNEFEPGGMGGNASASRRAKSDIGPSAIVSRPFGRRGRLVGTY